MKLHLFMILIISVVIFGLSACGNRIKSNTGNRLLNYAQSLSRGELDQFYINNRSYRGDLSDIKNNLPESQWGEAESALQKKYRDRLTIALQTGEWFYMAPGCFSFEEWAYRPHSDTTASLVETRLLTNTQLGLTDGFTAVFLQFTYANQTNAPKYNGKYVSKVVIRFICDPSQETSSLYPDQSSVVESSIVFHTNQ